MAVAAESQYHVLAVDDSITDRKLIERLLKTESFQVTTVDSGTKALEFLVYQHEIEVNLIITDYCMPGMTGYDLLKKIKELSCLKDIPVVIMSSENVPARINRCLEEGAEEFFLKPVQLSDMNRLRPHLMKTKSKEERELLLLQEAEDDESDTNPTPSDGDDDDDSNNNNNNSNNNNSGSKRGAMDEEDILPEKTRPRLCSTASLTLE